MKTITEIRLANLRLLVREAGSAAELSRSLDNVPQTYLSQILTGVRTPAGTRRGVGHKLARKLESAMRKPLGWMDQPHAPDGPADLPAEYRADDTQNPNQPTASQRVYLVGDVNGGPNAYGIADQTPDEYVDGYAIGPGAYALHVRGNSMSPRIREGDIVIASTTSAPVPGEDVVIMLKSGEHMVKELVSNGAGRVIVTSIGEDRARRILAATDIDYLHGVIGILPPSRARRIFT